MTTISASSTVGITLVSSSYTNPVVINPGVTISNSNGYGIGAYMTGAWTLQNHGTIESPVGIGVYLGSGGSITNAASASISGVNGVNITGGSGIVVNAGSIAGNTTQSIGVLLAAGGSVTNQTGAAISGYTGVDLTAGGLVTNASSASITGVYGGVEISGGGGTVVNSGYIAGTGGGGIGVLLGSGGTVTNAAGATITGVAYGVGLPAGGTLTNAGTIVGNSGTAISFGGSGGNLLVLDPGYGLSGIAIGGTSAVNALELAQGTGTGTLSALGATFTNFGTVIVDAGATWTVEAATSVLASTTFIGNGGSSVLEITNPGTFSLGGVNDFTTIDLAAGNNTVTVTDTTLSGGAVALQDGASGNNSISAVGDTAASKGKTLTWYTGTGTDSFTGGFENDIIHVSAAAVGGDTLTGGSGANTLVLASAGTVNLGGVSKFGQIDLAAGNNTVTVPDTTLSGDAVLHAGASGNNSISAGGDTAASKGKGLVYYAGPGTDSFTGGFENDMVYVSAAAVGGDVLTGGSGLNTLVLTSAGAVNLGGVSKFGGIYLFAGNSTVTVTDTTLSGGAVALQDGASGNNSISAVGDTAASKGKTLTWYTGTGTDSFTGGFENDIIHVSAAAVGGDTLTGGSGANTLVLTSAGTVNLGGVSKFGQIDLAAGNNTVTVTDTTLSGDAVLHAGASGNNSISAGGDTAASKGKGLVYYAGPGTDSFTGGFENDMVYVSAAAVGGDVLTGGSGLNTLVLTSAGAVNLGGVSKFGGIYLVAGNSTVTVTDTTLSGGAVALQDGASGNNSISAVGDTAASKGKTLTWYTGTGADSLTGGFENDIIHVSAAAVGGDTLTGGSGANTLVLASAGTVNLGGVSKFGQIDLAAGNNTVTVPDTTLSSDAVLHAGASGNNSISAGGDTAASKGKGLVYYAGPGTDSFTGGFENDMVYVSAAAVGGDVLTGGSGLNTLVLTSAGAVNLGGVSKFGGIYLVAGNSTVTVTDTTLSGGAVALQDGASGNNSISAVGDTAASKGKTLTWYTGTGTDSFTGGFENDIIHVSAAAVGGDTLTGGSGANTLVLASAGTVNLGGVSKFGQIDLAAGNNTVTVPDTTLSGDAVLHAGASGNNSISAGGDTAASKGKGLVYYAGPGTDSFTGGFENDMVYVSAAAVGGDVLTGGSGLNTLVLTSAGAVNLGGVSKFGGIYLFAGNSTVTVTDTTLSGGAVALQDGASGNNSISAVGDTAASKGKTLTWYTGTGTDSFTGGFENDIIHVSAAAVGGDTLTGGSGANTLVLASAGTVNLGGVSKFGQIDLAAGNNTVTVTDTTLSGDAVLHAGASGNNSISAAGDTAASKGKGLVYYAGPGTDSFTGGFENDTIYAGTGLGTFTAGGGSDSFVFMANNLPAQTLDNFQVSTDDVLVYGTHVSHGFDLGSTDNALNPLTPTAIDPTIFIANATGVFTNSSQRFAYDTSNGQLFYSATGSNASASLTATLGEMPAITASDLLFMH